MTTLYRKLRYEIDLIEASTIRAKNLLHQIVAQEKKTVSDYTARFRAIEEKIKADDTLEATELADKQAQIDALKAQAASGGTLSAADEAELKALEDEVGTSQTPSPTPGAPA